jgi:hypothetical protein
MSKPCSWMRRARSCSTGKEESTLQGCYKRHKAAAPSAACNLSASVSTAAGCLQMIASEGTGCALLRMSPPSVSGTIRSVP